MKTSYFRASPILLGLISLLLTCPGAFADNPNAWGRWGSGDVVAVVDVGGSLEIPEISDPSQFNLGLNNLGLPESGGAAPANPGDWVMYGLAFVNIIENMDSVYTEDGPLGMGPLFAITEGTLLLRPPAAEGPGGQLGFNLDRFIDVNSGEEVLFPLAVLAGGPEFPDAPEFVPFEGSGEAVANVPGFVEGNGSIFGNQLFDFGPGPGEEDGPVQQLFEPVPPEEIDFLSGGGFFFLVNIAEGPGGFNGDVFADGGFVAGQPTPDISALQAGNVIGEYRGFSSVFRMGVSVTMNFQPATFNADFSSQFGEFGVAGTINGSSFTSNSFTPVETIVTAATVDGTLFGPNAEALGGIVTFDVQGKGEGTDTFADIFVAGQEGVQLPRLQVEL